MRWSVLVPLVNFRSAVRRASLGTKSQATKDDELSKRGPARISRNGSRYVGKSSSV
jgi:hypothetical protein